MKYKVRITKHGSFQQTLLFTFFAVFLHSISFPLVVQETFSTVLHGRQAGEGQSDLASTDDFSTVKAAHLGMSSEPQHVTMHFTIMTTMDCKLSVQFLTNVMLFSISNNQPSLVNNIIV